MVILLRFALPYIQIKMKRTFAFGFAFSLFFGTPVGAETPEKKLQDLHSEVLNSLEVLRDFCEKNPEKEETYLSASIFMNYDENEPKADTLDFYILVRIGALTGHIQLSGPPAYAINCKNLR